jgi:hypothetical protein
LGAIRFSVLFSVSPSDGLSFSYHIRPVSQQHGTDVQHVSVLRRSSNEEAEPCHRPSPRNASGTRLTFGRIFYLVNTRLSFLLLLLCIVRAIAQDSAEPDWWPTVEEVSHFTAKSEDGNITLTVELTKPDEDSLTPQVAANGDTVGYTLNGEKLPERFWPGCALISRFELSWDGKRIDIPKRYWRDLAGFRIQTSSLKPDSLEPSLHWKAGQFLADLDQPRVTLSADGGTIMIQWGRPEECDGHSTIRWIIDRSGTILRHRHTPPHDC